MYKVMPLSPPTAKSVRNSKSLIFKLHQTRGHIGFPRILDSNSPRRVARFRRGEDVPSPIDQKMPVAKTSHDVGDTVDTISLSRAANVEDRGAVESQRLSYQFPCRQNKFFGIRKRLHAVRGVVSGALQEAAHGRVVHSVGQFAQVVCFSEQDRELF